MIYQQDLCVNLVTFKSLFREKLITEYSEKNSEKYFKHKSTAI